MKKNIINLILSLICSIIISLIFIPINVTGGFYNNTYLGRTNIISLLLKNEKICYSCNSYSINYLVFIIQIIVVFFMIYLLLKLFNGRKNK